MHLFLLMILQITLFFLLEKLMNVNLKGENHHLFELPYYYKYFVVFD